ncbi:MAG: DUF5682 family protein [Paludibaculum sp.]
MASATQGKQSTFTSELWQLKWEPEFAVEIIAAARWGNTVEAAASNYAGHLASIASGPARAHRPAGACTQGRLGHRGGTAGKESA